jgi:peptide/nickel transport system ATP-binding protein/oligopeptide transport system ATP-binding protein
MRQEETSILLITHDMGVIWEMCDRVVVMYASRIAEEAAKDDIFASPAHPYTRGLLQSIPKLAVDTDRLQAIPGQVPSPLNYPSGCHFRDRCPHAFDRCAHENPPLIELSNGHRSACWIAKKLINEKFSMG